jgi:hypothetical protein
MMCFKVHTCIAILGIGFNAGIFAQGGLHGTTSIEAGFGINLSYFDIGGGTPAPSFGASFLFELGESWMLGPDLGFHHCRGSDKDTPNAVREYKYISNIYQIALKGVYVIRFEQYPYKPWKRKLIPRIFAGLGLLQVQAVQDRKMFLENDKEYLPVAPLFSAGIGLEYGINRNISLVLEGWSNLSTSDHLEGHTHEDYSTASDMYHSVMLKVNYKIPSGWN